MRWFVLWFALFTTACEGVDPDPDPDPTPAPDPGPELVVCEEPVPEAPAGEVCGVSGTPGATELRVRGDVLADGVVYVGGTVTVSGASISCVGCDCPAAGEALEVSCRDAVVSPGLINAHDHITFSMAGPLDWGTERFDDRHDYRVGNAHTNLGVTSASSPEAVTWVEARQLLAGVTSLVGSGSAPGVVRNLDRSAQTLGLDFGAVRLEAFPLGDSDGRRAVEGCTTYSADPVDFDSLAAYVTHAGVGINPSAANALRCTLGIGEGAVDQTSEKTAIVHGIAVSSAEVAEIAAAGASLVWSPRSDLALFGDTAPVTLYDALEVPIALGTDWSATGSATMLRELACADSFDTAYLDDHFTDEALWRMATANAADAAGAGAVVGRLAEGYAADLVVFAARGREAHRAVIEADVPDVQLVLRGGTVMTGDADLVQALRADAGTACEALDACVADHLVCLDGDFSLAELRAALTDPYDLAICGVPPGEPTCVPSRAEADTPTYPGSDTTDGDNVDGDDCPSVFNPIRPMDDGVQADGDADGAGDVCDPCPLDAEDGC